MIKDWIRFWVDPEARQEVPALYMADSMDAVIGQIEKLAKRNEQEGEVCPDKSRMKK